MESNAPSVWSTELLIIRAATMGDIPLIDALVERVWNDPTTDLVCLPGESRLTGQDLVDYIVNVENRTLVSRLSDSSDAAVTGVVFLTRATPKVFDLGIITFPQGQGTGSKLIDAGIDLSTRCGITELHLEVFARNRAFNLYKRKGFETIEECQVPNQRQEQLQLFRMRLFLNDGFKLWKAAVAGEQNFWQSCKSRLERLFSTCRQFLSGVKPR